MTTALNLRPKAEAVQEAPAEAVTLQERIDAMVAEAVRNAPPSLSAEEQRKKNQAAVDMLHRWDEEDKADDPEELARPEVDWQEFKKGMNENSLSGRIIYPAEDYP